MKLHPLESVRAKIERANENILNLNAEITQFLRDTEPSVRIGNDERTGEQTIGVEGRIIPPLRYAVMAGEIVHHLRSALDHVVFQLVVLNGGTPTTRTEFPIFITLDDYEAKHEPKVRGISYDAKKLIASLQPFHKGHPAALDDPFWLVHQLDVTDKHRLLVVVARRSSVHLVTYTGSWPNTDAFRLTSISPDSSTEANAVLARFTSAPDMQVHPHVACEVVFDQIGTTQHEPVVSTLQHLRYVVSTVIERFVQFFP